MKMNHHRDVAGELVFLGDAETFRSAGEGDAQLLTDAARPPERSVATSPTQPSGSVTPLRPARWSSRASAPGGELVRLDPLMPTGLTSDYDSPAIRVLLVRGESLSRAGLRVLLERETDITVVAEAATGDDAVALAHHVRPDVVLMSSPFPGLGVLEATRRIIADPHSSRVQVLVVSETGRDDDLLGALRAGASGYLISDAEPAELIRGVRTLAGGGVQLSPSVTRRLIDEFASQPASRPATPELFDELTVREREVVGLVAEGLTNREIAERLIVSPATAKTHVSRAMIKLHIRDRAKLVALAYETGFAQVPRHRARVDEAGPRREPSIIARRNVR